jgi:hypothetical protein
LDAKINDLYLAYKLFRLFLNKEKYTTLCSEELERIQFVNIIFAPL